MTDYNEYFDEVIQAHVAIEQWLAKERDPAELEQLLRRFSPQFSMVSPLGRVLDFDALNELFLMAAGKKVYDKQCVSCHQASGQGLPPAFPALAGSKIVNTPLLDMNGKIVKDSHVDRVLNGKPGTAMQAFRNTLSDVELAAVITYERNSFGNRRGDMIQPAQIKALR